jgi:PAS domain S-box-containing protein
MDRSDLEQWKPKEVARLLALVEAERRYYQEIVAGLPVGLLVLSSDLSIISANTAIRRIFHLRSGDPLRGKLDLLMPADVLDKVREVFASGAPQSDVTVPIPAEHGGGALRIVIQPIRSWDYTEEQEALLTILETAVAPAPAVEAIPEPAPEPITEPVSEPGPEPIPEPIPEPAAEPPAETEPEAPPEEVSAEPPIEEVPAVTEPSISEPLPEPAPEIVADAVPEPVAEALPEPGALELLQSLDAIVWAAALPDLRFLFVNEAAQRLFGWTPEQWTKAPAFHRERIHPGDRERVAREYQDAIQRGVSVTVEFRALEASGGTAWLRETMRPLLDDEGTPRYAVGFAIDITERRREEEARIQAGRSDALMKLCSRLAHDMNNLLMIVNGYSEDIIGTFVGASALQADLAEVRRAGERLSGIADQLLAFTRRKADDATSLDATGVLHEVAAALAPTLPEGTTLNVSAAAPVYVRASHEQLRESVTAFVEYAIHSLSKGGEITLGTGEAAGFGIIAISPAAQDGSPDAWQSLFEGILPVKDSPAAAVQGISRAWSWVQQWGGAIEVETAPDAGTRIAMRLPAGEGPAIAPEPAAEAVAVEAPPEPEPEPQPETVLVVEDEAGIRTLVRKILERQGYRVLDAPQADAAIRLCQEFPGIIQLVITDVIMPEMGGREMVEKLMEIRPGIKVLYVSGYTDDPQVHAAHISQGSAFLQKPFTLGALLDKVREVLEA